MEQVRTALMATGLGDRQMRVVRAAAELCAASLGTDGALLDDSFRTIETFTAAEKRIGSICELVGAAPDGAARCTIAQKAGGGRAVQLGGAYFYACHAELVEAIVPMQRNGTIIGYVLIRPVLLAPADALLTKKIAEQLSSLHVGGEAVRTEIELIPVVEPERFKRTMNLLSELISASLSEPDVAAQGGDGVAQERQESVPVPPPPASASSRGHRKTATDSSAKERFILAKSRLGNLAEVRQDVCEIILRKAEWHLSADIERAAALETVSALWRTAMGENGAGGQPDPRNLGLRELFAAQTVSAVLDWAAGAAKRIGRNSGPVPSQPRSALKKIQKYTRRSLAQKLSSARVAQAVGIDSRELERMVERHLGVSFREYLSMERLTLARKLLRETKLTATEIAAKTGSSDQSNFTKLFVKFEGITPIQYRMNTIQTARLLQLQQRDE